MIDIMRYITMINQALSDNPPRFPAARAAITKAQVAWLSGVEKVQPRIRDNEILDLSLQDLGVPERECSAISRLTNIHDVRGLVSVTADKITSLPYCSDSTVVVMLDQLGSIFCRKHGLLEGFEEIVGMDIFEIQD